MLLEGEVILEPFPDADGSIMTWTKAVYSGARLLLQVTTNERVKPDIHGRDLEFWAIKIPHTHSITVQSRADRQIPSQIRSSSYPIITTLRLLRHVDGARDELVRAGLARDGTDEEVLRLDAQRLLHLQHVRRVVHDEVEVLEDRHERDLGFLPRERAALQVREVNICIEA